MANIKESLKILSKLEYSNRQEKFLHKNKKEHDFTCGGIYAHANPKALDWKLVQNVVLACNNIERASVMLFHDKILNEQIERFCKEEIWDAMRLDEVDSQKIADEMFLFAFHTHWKTAAKVAQRTIGIKDDGFIGNMSLAALNTFSEEVFDIKYDEREKEHYKAIIERRPYLQDNYDGWCNRADAV